eukprot:TRINITY_DN2898_c0_g1_i11.p1 TRINITY_DN2898_c0_g1~~TRINITY_DN2898_c0_g1_i11.p1  ORF type:complete len:158 (-),score=23.97 TRINITY_DN2898_c0_g1_i11:924-1397(-)
MSSEPVLEKLNSQTKRKVQKIFQLSDTPTFLLNFAITLGQTGESLQAEQLASKYGLSLEHATKLSLATRLLQGIIPATCLEPSVPEEISPSTIYVRNLPLVVTESEVLGVFQNFGPIKEVRMQHDKETGQFFGFVQFFFFCPGSTYGTVQYCSRVKS